MKKMLTVTGLALLLLAGCQMPGEAEIADDTAMPLPPAEEVVLPPVNEVTPVETTLPTDSENMVENELPVTDATMVEVNN